MSKGLEKTVLRRTHPHGTMSTGEVEAACLCRGLLGLGTCFALGVQDRKGSRLFELSCSALTQARSVEGPTALSPFLVSLTFCFLPKIIYEFP